MTNPRGRALLDQARELAPSIRANAEQIEADRCLPGPLFEALADAGFFHMLIPRGLGGAELDLPTFIRVIEVLGAADASTAWCINQGAVFATWSTHLPPEVAHEIWLAQPRSVVANSPAPEAVARVVEGGYRVSGRLSFSTGCCHSTWQAAHARIVQDDRPRLLPNGQPETRYLLVPKAEAEILDTWRVRGMRGTGTHHFKVDDVFVPERRTFISPGQPLSIPGPLYLIPRTLLFAAGDAAVALAVARVSLDGFIELAGGKTPYRDQKQLREQGRIQWNVGRAEAQIRTGRAFLREAVDEAWQEVCSTSAISVERRVGLRLATSHAIRLAVEVVDTVYDDAGTTAIYESSPFQRYFQDIHVISQHIQSRLNNYELVGQALLGLEPDLTRM